MKERTNLIRQASVIALFGNAALSAAKILTGLLSGSLAVIGDGIDSSTDVVIACITFFTAGIAGKPADRGHPYGHQRAETIATILLAFIIFFAGAQLILSTIHVMLEGSKLEVPSLAAVVVSLVSMVGKTLLALTQYSLGKKAGSQLLIANGVNMRNDIILSGAVLTGVGLSVLLGLPLIDKIFALLVGVYILKSAVGIFMETNSELMDGSPDNGLYAQIFGAVQSVPGVSNPHRTRARRLGGSWVIDLDIEVDGALTVTAAHGLAVRVEQAVRSGVENVYDVIVHVEPYGNIESGEAFGLEPSADKKGKNAG